jgi:SAM-dependent methyltransferase
VLHVLVARSIAQREHFDGQSDFGGVEFPANQKVAMLNRGLVYKVRVVGGAGLFGAALRRVFARPIAAFGECRGFFTDAVGLEVGGPSTIFSRRGLFPVYPIANRVDNCNFNAQTIWESVLEGGPTFCFDKGRPCGTQYFFEATDLSGIASNSYDFVLSSHALEHVANPLLALTELIRCLKTDGILALVLPHKEGTFDHRRPVTTLEHLIADFERGTPESDATHLAEILQLHDLSRDPEAGGIDAFTLRARQNLENRGLHHHVFDTALAVCVVAWGGLQILAVEALRPYHIFIVAKKLAQGQSPDNQSFMGSRALYRQKSPFASDRRC